MNYSREISEFIRDTCEQLTKPDRSVFHELGMHPFTAVHPSDGSETTVIPQVTGSTAEFRIVPMLSCIGDVDIMFYYSCELAIPEGNSPPTRLPAEFGKRVKVYKIRDTGFPGYVFLVLTYLLTKHNSGRSYSTLKYNIQQSPLRHGHYIRGTNVHGPASLHQVNLSAMITGVETIMQADCVKCMHSLAWPPQGADWPTRYRKYGWPDSATIDCVVSKGCDVVPVAHSQCKLDEWMSDHQWRLSFSRAEVELINRWNPEQQIVYHMLRVFMKTVQLTDSAVGSLNNYHIKTLMLWACELQPRSWWTSKSSLVAICAHLLRRFSIWLTKANCQHYFVSKCNLFELCVNSFDLQTAAAICQSMTEEALSRWFVDNYVRKCATVCPDNIVLLLEDVQTKVQFQNATLAIKRWKQHVALPHLVKEMCTADLMCEIFSDGGAECSNASTVVDIMCSYLMSWMEKNRSVSFCNASCMMLSMACIGLWQRLNVSSYLDGFVDFMYHFILQFKGDRYPENKITDHWNLLSHMRSLFCQTNSVEFQAKAATLMKFLSATPYGPEDWDCVIIAKFCLHEAMSRDAKNDEVYCLANVYGAVLYYITGQYQTAIDHCTLVTRGQRHSTKCSSHVVVGELLPKIDDNIDNALGLSVLYQYVRTTALNRREHETHQVRIFTTEQFAHYLTLKCLLAAKCFLAEVSLVRSTAVSMKFSVCQELELYRKHMLESKRLSVSDLLLAKLPNLRYKCSGDREMVDIISMLTANPPKLSELTQLLRRNSVENLLSCPRFHEQNFGPVFVSYFEPLNLYRCCLNEKCIQICREIALKMINSSGVCVPLVSTTYSEFVQLMDTDLVSLMGLMILVNPDITHAFHSITISQLSLSLYLMTRCQLMRHHGHHDRASLLQTLNLIDESLRSVSFRRIFDRPVLQLSRKLLLHAVHGRTIDFIQKPRSLTRRNRNPQPCNLTDVLRSFFRLCCKFIQLNNGLA